MSGKPLVSVVTPVYNGEEFLADCIESVLEQSWPHFEYLIVDNRSTDATRSIAERYAAKDSRIKVVACSEFVAQLDNFNRAMKLISLDADLAKVVCADDGLVPQCLEKMVEVAKEYPDVQLIGAGFMWGHEPIINPPIPGELVVSGAEACRVRLLRGGTFFGSTTTHIYRAAVTRSRAAFFPPSTWHWDLGACFEVLHHSRFAYIPETLSFVRVDNPSITNSVRDMQPDVLRNIELIKTYGPMYLSDQEYSERMSLMMLQNRRVLASGLRELRGLEFWRQQRRWRAMVGLEMSHADVMLEVAREFAAAIKRRIRGVFTRNDGNSIT